MKKINFQDFERQIPEILLNLDSREAIKLKRLATQRFMKIINSTGSNIKTKLKKGNKPFFGAKVSKKKKTQGFIYSAFQNPATMPELFTTLPTTKRVRTNSYVAFIYGKFRTLHTKTDNRFSLFPKDSRLSIESYDEKPMDPSTNLYYFKNPVGGYIFGRDRVKKKSYNLEINFSGVEEYLKQHSQEDISRYAYLAWDFVLTNYLASRI